MDGINSTLGARIQQLRATYNLTQRNLADKLGWQPNERSKLSTVESDSNSPSYEFVVEIANIFTNVRLEWLLLGSGDMLKDMSVLGDIAPFKPKPKTRTLKEYQDTIEALEKRILELAQDKLHLQKSNDALTRAMALLDGAAV